MSRYNSCAIIGASFGGLACAMAVKQKNPSVSVTLIDRADPPIPQTTGGVAKTWFEGVDMPIPPSCIARDIHGFRMISPGGKEAVFRFPQVAGHTLYHEKWVEYLLDECEKMGVNMMLGTKVNEIRQVKWQGISVNQYFIKDPQIKADVIVAADGANSFIGRHLGRPDIDLMDFHIGYEHTIDAAPNWDQDLFHIIISKELAPFGYAWVFPEGEDRARVGLGIPKALNENPKDYFKKLLIKYPEFDRPAHKVLGGQIPTARVPESNRQANVLYVGDAGRFCSPLHGGGIGFAAMSGSLAGKVIAEGLSLERYDVLWKRRIGKLLKRHYGLKKFFFNLSEEEFDNVVEILAGYKPVGTHPWKELVHLIKYLLRHYPGAVPKFMKYSKPFW